MPSPRSASPRSANKSSVGGPKSRVQASIAGRSAQGSARAPVVLKATLTRPAAKKSGPVKPAPVKPAPVATSKASVKAVTKGSPQKAAARKAVVGKPIVRAAVKATRAPAAKAPRAVASARSTAKTPIKPALPARVGRAVPPLARPAARGKAGKVLLRGAQPATRLVRVKALDPCSRCGPNTSVEQLYRVDEQVAGTATVHLVFYDRHGWYCVHGATCVAVRDVHAELKAHRSAARGRQRGR